MSLYDDLPDDNSVGELMKKRISADVAAWGSGIKMLQSQMLVRKAGLTGKLKDNSRKTVISPVVDLNTKKDDHIIEKSGSTIFTPGGGKGRNKENRAQTAKNALDADPDWAAIGNEYDPLYPNDYEKVIKEIKRKRDQEEKQKKAEAKARLLREKYGDGQPAQVSGFSKRPDDETSEETEKPASKRTGAAIAPPPSLDGPVDPPPNEFPPPSSSPPLNIVMPDKPSFSIPGVGGNVAAKIMAKYGYKEGQGLGKNEQGLSTALSVEKTSKRGGRIVNKDKESSEPSNTTEAMKNPSKVVCLTNMVGPGEVDDDLEPEVREECHGKYGEVTRCIIFEIPGAAEDEAVRIFVEFKRMESAIKALVDLNGRYFGGRLVQGKFYSQDKFNSLDLGD